MMKRWKMQSLSLLLTLALCFGLSGAAKAMPSAEALSAAAADTAAYLYQTVPDPQVGSIGGEWVVLGLARSGYDVPEGYYQDYYAAVEKYVKACGGVLDERKYTEYSRLIVALSAIGRDARNVAGYDLTAPLGDYEKTVWQGINGPIWALIALDSAGYPMPENSAAAVQATRQMYVDRILDCQLPDGGWSLYGGTEAAGSGDGGSDPDITGMALQALAKYQEQPAVAQAVQEALSCMSRMQDADGGFSSWGTANSESCVQMIVALTELGIPLDDARFVKNGYTMLDNLMTFYQKGAGFVHVQSGSGSSQMATEQGFYGLVAALRAQEGKNSLYRMDDALSIPDAAESGGSAAGLADKHPDVAAVPVTAPGKTFFDIASSPAASAIETLAARAIITGKSDDIFDPDGNMTRSEFSAIVVRALGLLPQERGQFSDVPAGTWYAAFVDTAAAYGIVTGTGGGAFSPQGTITRQEAAVMVARAAALCGIDTQMEAGAVRNMLAQFPDYMTTAEWARQALAFCYRDGILDQAELNISPAQTITRAEVAQMLFRLLSRAELL